MKIQLPNKVKSIIDTLIEHGHEAYAVGGCVRDSILGRDPDDWDITTSAKPDQVKAIFSYTIDTGLEHGTVTVMMDHEGYEVTTYRVDGEYEDHRHPTSVLFTANLIEDLKRRDFTINAMAYNDIIGLVDAFAGLADLKAGIIRCVGDPIERFNEDALRILRAVRFSAQLGFFIDPLTERAISEYCSNLEHISAERIQVELVKLLTSDHPETINKAYELGITKVILPEFDAMMETPQKNPHHDSTVGIHTLRALMHIEKSKDLRLIMLFHDVGKPLTRTTDSFGRDHFYDHAKKGSELTKKILRRLKFDNGTIKKVTHLIKYHDHRPNITPEGVRRGIYQVGEEYYPDLLKIMESDILAKNAFRREEKLEALNQIKNLYEDIVKEKQCVSLKTLAITGADLLDLGEKPSKKIGEILNLLLEDVLIEPSHNEKEYLLEQAKKILASSSF
ncbi:MAG TPA: CCA tRNA nucleotidyltransferase [Candidatus Merdenecus merdavium]|nr:CCA tRNA nucleotidyltransferase [Candidatus Merdenecus merdavium]